MTLLLRKSLLRVSLALAGLAAVAVSTRFVLWQGLLGPIRVVSGSMAETLLGEHYRLVCADCGRVFHCGRESPPPAMQAVCPNCGYSQNAAAAELLQAGQRVLIDQFVPAAGPRRWEMVAFTSPDGASELTVKRVVGLPGETLEIRGGDIYIDGRIARKDFARQREVAVLVHDHDFRPLQQSADLPPRWQADAADSHWRASGGGFTLMPQGETNSATLGEIPYDWLTYRHWRCASSPLPRSEEAPLRDNDGYNQGLSRELHLVGDLMLVCRLNVAGPGQVIFRTSDGRDLLEAMIEPDGRRLRLFRNATELASARWPKHYAGRSVELAFSTFDRQALIAVDGAVLIEQPLSDSDRPLTPTSRPLAIAARHVAISVERLRVFRDLHYLDPRGFDRPWQAPTLTEDELFVLGDNVPVSRDSRAWRQPLTRDAVIGGVSLFESRR